VLATGSLANLAPMPVLLPNPVLEALPAVGSRELETRVAAARRDGVDVLPLNPYPVRTLPAHVLEAAKRAMRENQESPSRGLRSLREAIADDIRPELGRAVDPESEVLVTNGAMHALNLVFRSILRPGDEVVVPAPCYFFHGCIELAGGVAVHVPMREEERFAWDHAAIRRAITRRARAIIVSSPVNPTGYVLSSADLGALARLAIERDLLLISDESYDRMVYDGAAHLSVAALPEATARTVLIRSFTKSFAMPAWRVGYIVAPASLVNLFAKALEWEFLHPSHVGQAACAAAVRGDRGWLGDIAAEFQGRRDRLLDGLSAIPRVSCAPPRGGPFVFLDVHRLYASSHAASDALLAVGVPTTPGWYCQSDRHVRLAFGATDETLDRAVERIACLVGSVA
jgi:aspartate/methionine/tyrosine aminotransferase